jgi:hypothetical protein
VTDHMHGNQRPPATVIVREKRRTHWGRKVAGLFAILLAFSILIPIVVVLTVGRQISDSMVPQYSNTLQKVRKAEVMRRFMIPADSSVTPMRAGEALISLGAREGMKVHALARRPARGPYSLPVPDPGLFPDARPAEWSGPAATKIILASQRGFTREEMDYLASLAANPIWEEYAIVARAPRMDLAGAFYKAPFPERVTAVELPIIKFAATKEIALANASRAAWHLANHRPQEAEHVLRETISNGFRLLDDGNTLIDDLIGVVIVGIGRAGLEQLYEITKNPELDRIRSEAELIERTPVPAAQLKGSDRAALAHAITDTTLPRGLRYELVMTGNLNMCTTVKGLFAGRSKEFESALATARTRLVRSPAEGDLFDLNMHVVDRPNNLADGGDIGGFPRAIILSSHVPAWLLRNPRMVNCAGAYAGGLAAAM